MSEGKDLSDKLKNCRKDVSRLRQKLAECKMEHLEEEVEQLRERVITLERKPGSNSGSKTDKPREQKREDDKPREQKIPDDGYQKTPYEIAMEAFEEYERENLGSMKWDPSPSPSQWREYRRSAKRAYEEYEREKDEEARKQRESVAEAYKRATAESKYTEEQETPAENYNSKILTF